MSLISTRSFIAPLLDKRNLITILLIAVFFGVFRWAGGGVSTAIPAKKSNTDQPKVEMSDALKGDPSTLFEQDEFAPTDHRLEVKELTISRKSAKARPKANLSEEDVLKMIAPKKQEAPRKKDFEAGESLDDIERSLGLR